MPGAMPVTTPVPGTTVAVAAGATLHVPPAVASVRVVLLPWHMLSVPFIGVVGFTVMFTLPVVVMPHASVTVSV